MYYRVEPMTPDELKRRRLELGMSQRDLARALGATPRGILKDLANVYLWESGRRAIPQDLDYWLKWLAHEKLKQENQPILDRCLVSLEQFRQIVAVAGMRGSTPDISMFNTYGKNVYWWYTPDHPVYWVIGETGSGECYAVPRNIQPALRLELPEYLGMTITRPDGTIANI